MDVFESKVAIIKRTVASWPRYAFLEEDMALRSPKWVERYMNKRVIMWDNTDEPFQGKPSDGELQRLTFSLYYGLNVAKGGIYPSAVWLAGRLGTLVGRNLRY
jgi:hypothetical protein